MTSKTTPLMTQYQEIKRRYSEGILLFQVGDFYETFYDDARKVSRILNIALTSRDKKNPVPLAGVPIHAVDAYISRLLQAGEKIVICDQVEKPGDTKGIVRRQVTDIITPGTSLSPATLQDSENNFILSVCGKGDLLGFSIIDLSTGEFYAAQEQVAVAENIISGYQVKEAVIPRDSDDIRKMIRDVNPACIFSETDEFLFNERECRQELLSHFSVTNLVGFGIEDKYLAILSSGALLIHIKNLRQSDLKHISSLSVLTPQDTLSLDTETVRNLELLEPLRGNSGETTLVHHIDRTKTAAGARLLRDWLMHPSRIVEVIEGRLDGVSDFYNRQIVLREIRKKLAGFTDIERILSRVTTGKAGPRELLFLSDSLKKVEEITVICDGLKADIIERNVRSARTPHGAVELIERSIEPDSPVKMRDGGYIRKGYDSDLDLLIESTEDGRKWLAALQQAERKRTGIPSLKVGYNKVFGYYIEVSKLHLDKVPEDYVGKQTLVSSQRYITEELKEKENLILTADSRRTELEREIFSEICIKITEESSIIQKIAKSVATLDLISSLADLALEREYCRPEIDSSEDLMITEGRHPVVEIISDSNFIPNDLLLRPKEKQLLMITGPNMGGKSTYIRQVALITIMAQMGSFVPASRVKMGVIDRVFTRVGSSDNLARGQSTFLVEMGETARILNNCTSKSLVLLDEIGRGTSTLDGLSIAWSVTEYLMEEEGRRPKTLFATHFHELTELSEKYPRIENMRVEVKEWSNSILFLYRILQGRSDKSYGIHVAQLAGLPEKVIERAWEIFRQIEKSHGRQDMSDVNSSRQQDLFERLDPVHEKLRSLDLDNITPIEALRILSDLRELSE